MIAPPPVLVIETEPTVMLKGPIPMTELVPEKVTFSGPPLVAVTEPLRMMLFALRTIPALVLVLMPTFEVIVPVDVRLTEAAVTPLPVTLLQLVTT